MNAERQVFHAAAILNVEPEAMIAPAVFLSMVSPMLDMGMRVELSMRAVLKVSSPHRVAV